MSDQARKTGKVVQPYGLQPPLPRPIKTSPPYSSSSLEPTSFTLMHKPNVAYNEPVPFQNWNEGLGSGYAALPHYFMNEPTESCSDGSVVNSSEPPITQAPLHVLDSFAQAFTQSSLGPHTQIIPQCMLGHAPAQRDHAEVMRHVHPVLQQQQQQQQQQQHITGILQDALPSHHGGMYQTLHKAGVAENWQRGWRHEDTQEAMVSERQPCFRTLPRIVQQRAVPVDSIRSCFPGPLMGDKLMAMQQQMPLMHGQFQRHQIVPPHMQQQQQQQQQPQQPIHGLQHPHLSSVQVSGGVVTENQVAMLADASVQRLATPPLSEIPSSHDTLQHRVTPPILSTPTSSVSSGTGLEKQDQPLSPADKERFHHRDQAPLVLPVSVPVTPKSSEAGGALSQAEEQRGSSRTCDAQGRNSDDEMPVLDKATPTVPSSWNHIPRKSELLRKRSLPAKWPRRPNPLIIPPPLTIASSYPGATLYQSQLRSPRIASGETAHLPLYTPPPMLSPVRQGSGLYFSGVLSSSHGHSSETLAPAIAPSLTPRIILSQPGSGECLKVPVDSEDAQVSISPHINIGVAFQADIPFLQRREDVALDKHLATLVWVPRSVTEDKEVDVLLNLACSSAVHGGGMNIELALHVLHEENGDLKAALEFLLLQEANRPSSHPLADYHYSGSAYWSQNDKKLFEQSLTSHGKDFFFLCKTMKTKTMAQCIEYYYTWKALIRCSRHRTRQGIIGNDGMGLGENYDDDNDELEDALIRRDGRRSASFGPMSDDDEDRGHSRDSPPELELQLGTFVCNFPQCGIAFSSRQALNGHIRIHRGYNVDLLASTALSHTTPANSVFMKPSASKSNSTVMAFPPRPPPFSDQNIQTPLKQPKVVGAQVATAPRSRSNAGQKGKGPPGLGHGTLGPEGTVIFPCKECGKVFHKVKSRNAHMKSHRQQEEQQRQAARRVAALVADAPAQIPAKTQAAASRLGHPTTSSHRLHPPQPQCARQPQRFGWDTEDEDRVRQSHRERGRPLVDPWCDEEFMESDLVIDEELG